MFSHLIFCIYVHFHHLKIMMNPIVIWDTETSQLNSKNKEPEIVCGTESLGTSANPIVISDTETSQLGCSSTNPVFISDTESESDFFPMSLSHMNSDRESVTSEGGSYATSELSPPSSPGTVNYSWTPCSFDSEDEYIVPECEDENQLPGMFLIYHDFLSFLCHVN